MSEFTVRRVIVGGRSSWASTAPTFAMAVADAVEFVTKNPKAWQVTVVNEDAIVLADLKSVRR